MSKTFASQADLADKTITFERLSEHAYAYTAQGDPNTGIVVGDDAAMVVDTQATPVMAQEVIRRVAAVTDKPIAYVVLTHYHAVRVLGASAYKPRHVIASQDTADLIAERGEADMKSEIERFPRLFRAVESIPGLTWPTLTFRGEMRLHLGSVEVRLIQLGRGHTKGDAVVWLPQERTLFSGDLVEFGATPYCGDAYFTDWPLTLDALSALEPAQLLPGRGGALHDRDQTRAGIAGTRAFVSDLFSAVREGVAAGMGLREVYASAYERLAPQYGRWVIFDHCMPFNVSRAYDEATGYRDPRVWTAQRDRELWQSLEGATPKKS